MNKKVWISILVIIVIIIGAYYFMQTKSMAPTVPQNQQQTPIVETPAKTITTTTTTITNTPVVSSAQTREISVVNFSFDPSMLTINKGDTIVWTNNDSVPHQVVGDSLKTLDGPVMSKGQTYSFTFNTAGNFSYHCAIHPMMKGNIIVK